MTTYPSEGPHPAPSVSAFRSDRPSPPTFESGELCCSLVECEDKCHDKNHVTSATPKDSQMRTNPNSPMPAILVRVRCRLSTFNRRMLLLFSFFLCISSPSSAQDTFRIAVNHSDPAFLGYLQDMSDKLAQELRIQMELTLMEPDSNPLAALNDTNNEQCHLAFLETDFLFDMLGSCALSRPFLLKGPTHVSSLLGEYAEQMQADLGVESWQPWYLGSDIFVSHEPFQTPSDVAYRTVWAYSDLSGFDVNQMARLESPLPDALRSGEIEIYETPLLQLTPEGLHDFSLVMTNHGLSTMTPVVCTGASSVSDAVELQNLRQRVNEFAHQYTLTTADREPRATATTVAR